MKKVRNLIAILAVVMLLVLNVTPAFATEDEVRAVADGVLFLSQNIDGQPYTRGSCFLINEDTVITSNHCVHFTNVEYKALYDLYGYKQEDVDKLLTYTVTIQSDFTIPATLVNSSELMDFAILKLSQPISNHTYLKLRDSKTVKPAETVYSVGFPAAKDTTWYYNQKDITFESGTINKTQFTLEDYWVADSPFFFYEDENGVAVPVQVPYDFKGEALIVSGGTFTGGNSGGPLVDANGNVIGVCAAGDGGTSCYASAIDQVMEVLDTVNIEYTAASDTPEPTTGAVDDTTTAAATTAAPEPTTGSGKSLGIGTGAIIGIAVAAVVVILLIVVIIVVASKKKKGGPDDANGGFAPAGPPQQPPMPPQQPPMAPPAAPPQAPPAAPAGGDVEGTTILSSNMGGADETTVLGASATNAYLVNKATGERINIDKPYFKIGKDPSKVDYCVKNNPSVSRFHAAIVLKNGEYFIFDNGATNHTFINDTIIPAKAETPISDGATIKLADEKFEFKLS